MQLHADPLYFRLPHHETLALRDARGARVRCASGVIWLTEEGVEDDVFLRAGEEYVLSGKGLALLRAEADASIVLSRRCNESIRRWWQALGAWLRGESPGNARQMRLSKHLYWELMCRM